MENPSVPAPEQPATQTPVPVKPVHKISWPIIVVLILLVLVIIFAVFNTHSVTLSLVFVQLSAPLIVIILCSAAIGAILALLSVLFIRRNQNKPKN